MTDVVLVLCFLVLYWMVLGTDWIFRRTPPDCACGGEMYRTTAVSTEGQVVRHVPVWTCHECGAMVEMHSHGTIQRLTNWWRKDRSLRKPAAP